MKKLFAFLILIQMSLITHSQVVKEFNAKYTFLYVSEYDFDFQRYTSTTQCPIEILFKVTGGSGTFHMLVTEKQSFYVDKVEKSGSSYVFTIRNSENTIFRGTLSSLNGYVDKFILRPISLQNGLVLHNN